MVVRPWSESERHLVLAGLRSADAFTWRRCQIVLASDRREPVPRLARELGCGEQTVRNAIHAFNTLGGAALRPGSSRPHTIQAAFSAEQAEQLRALLHRSPRTFRRPTSVWTLDLAAQVSFEQGLTPERVSGETIRATLKRLGVGWKRAKRWLVSPDPAYARNKAVATG
jgi:transposase